jgi:hypothetical protein
MSNYSINPCSCRVDFFKPSGKWYTTEAIIWDRYHTNGLGGFEDIQATFKRLLREQLKGRLSDTTAVCLQPYHEFSHPLMVKDWNNA